MLGEDKEERDEEEGVRRGGFSWLMSLKVRTFISGVT